MAYRDIVIIGSGFGGAVMAARLGAAARAAGKTVLVLEKGVDHTGRFDPQTDGGPFDARGNRFKHTHAPDYLATVLDVWADRSGAFRSGKPSMNVVAGRGFGGGSNVYDGVSLRAPAESFEQTRDGARLWPALFTRAALDPYYEKVEAKLRVHRLAWTESKDVPHWQLATKRDFVFADGCRRIGATAMPLKVATHEDANEGWWNQGQRFNGRQNLTQNYLADALASGVAFVSGCEVTKIAPTKGGYALSGIDRRGGGEKPLDLECALVIVACGSVASTALLLRSASAFTGARALEANGALGKNVSGNGDYGVTGIVGARYEFPVEGFKGKPMSSFTPSFWKQQKFILIPFYAAPLHLALNQPSSILRAEDPGARGRGSAKPGTDERDYGLAYKTRLREFGSRMLTMGCLALDDCEGEIRLGEDDAPEVRWPRTSDRTESRWSAAADAMSKIYDALGGEMYLDAYRRDGTVNTAHPLGGCRMGAVTTDLGEHTTNPNLFVIDGASIPSALGVNPSLTIAAVAESIADRLISGIGSRSFVDRLP